MENFLFAIGAIVFISLLSLLGIFTLTTKSQMLDRLLLILVSFAAGAILGAAFFDLLPEAIELVNETQVFLFVSAGFLLFFVLERFIYWFHGHGHIHHNSKTDENPDVELECHSSKGNNPIPAGFDDDRRSLAILNLLGDGIHNFLDGMIIAASFSLGITVGTVATLAVFFHELPQEMGDFGVLVYGGFTKKTALGLNFLTALTAIGGALTVLVFSGVVEGFTGILVAFSAGGFTYLAASELIPEMQKEKNLKKSALQFVLFTVGLFLIWYLGIAFPE